MPTELTFIDADTAATRLATEIADRLREAIATRGRASLVVSGGRSPIALFKKLSRQPLDWSRVWITLADERWVDATWPDSNEHLVREYLLSDEARVAHFVPLKTAAATPAAALPECATALAAMPRPFDVVMLGMGDDGHTASLFPGAAGLAAALDPAGTEMLAAIDAPAAACPRITLTLAALLDARLICLQIQGESKRNIYTQARHCVAPTELPISAVLNQTTVPVLVCIIES